MSLVAASERDMVSPMWDLDGIELPEPRIPWRTPLMLAGVAACYVAVIAARPLVAPGEFRYAEVPREMLATGDWIVPRLDGVVYFEKPPLGYWLTALSIRELGENAIAVRPGRSFLPPAIPVDRSETGGAALFAVYEPMGRAPQLSRSAG